MRCVERSRGGSTRAGGRALEGFHGSGERADSGKSGFLLAGVMGRGGVDQNAGRDFAAKLDLDFNRQSRWSSLIEQAADANNQALVALLAGGWKAGKGGGPGAGGGPHPHRFPL